MARDTQEQMLLQWHKLGLTLVPVEGQPLPPVLVPPADARPHPQVPLLKGDPGS